MDYSYDPENIFAKILRGEIPNDTVFENDYALHFFPQPFGRFRIKAAAAFWPYSVSAPVQSVYTFAIQLLLEGL